MACGGQAPLVGPAVTPSGDGRTAVRAITVELDVAGAPTCGRVAVLAEGAPPDTRERAGEGRQGG